MLHRSLPVALALIALAPPAAADGPPAPQTAVVPARPADAQTKAAIEKQRARFAAAMRPELRTRVLAAARLLAQRLDAPVAANARPPDPLVVARQVASDGQSFPGFTLGASDVEALALIVMMEATKGTDDDLKQIMAQQKAIEAAKAAWRTAADRVNAQQRVDALAPTPPLTKADLDALLAPARDNPGALDALGQTQAQRLQMAMDRLSKLMAALSNVLKKISDTDASIVQNMK